MTHPRFHRLSAAAMLALGAVLTLSAPSAVAQTDASLIRVGTGPNDPSMPLIYGDKGGAFKRAGLNVEVSRQATTSTMAAAVLGGSLEIAQGSGLGAIHIISKGVPLTLVGNLALYNADHPDTALLVLTGSTIKTPKDMEGKTLAGVALGDLNSISTVMWLDQRGVDTSTLKFVEIPASASLAAMEQNRIEATTVYEPFYSAFVASGKARVLGYPYDSLGRHWADSVIFARTDWVAAHGPLVGRFLRALQEAAIQPIIDAAAKYKLIPKTFAAQDIICSCARRK